MTRLQYNRLKAVCMRVARKMGLRHHQAEESFHDFLIKRLSGLKQRYEQTAIDYLRRETKYLKHRVAIDDVPLETYTIDEILMYETASKLLTHDEKYIVACLIAGLTQQEIAAEMGCTQPKIHYLLKYCRLTVPWLKRLQKK